ncbi:FecR domain-containing protein [Candidatus Sumerlaeota bacterium]|nr:FecR domain-containing protein [Candidatus Sumerlaeota bacterium]
MSDEIYNELEESLKPGMDADNQDGDPKDLLLARQILHVKREDRKQHTRRTERLSEYIAAQIREQEAAQDTEISLLMRLRNLLWNGYIDLLAKLGLLKRPDDEFNPAPSKSKTIPALTPYAALALLLLLLAGAIFLLHGGRHTQTAMQNSTPARSFTTNNQQRHWIDLTPEVQIAMNNQTAIQQLSATKINLDQGQIWLEVQKGGQGFQVNSSCGLITVQGTSFGVAQRDGALEVRVAEGAVRFHQAKKTTIIEAGQTMRIANASAAPVIVSSSASRPDWVLNMADQKSLVAYWPLDESLDQARAQVTDMGPYGLHGAIRPGEEPVFGEPSADANLFGQSARFHVNQNLQAIYIPQNDIMKQLDRFTVMAWVKRDSFDAYPRIIASDTGAWRFGFHEGDSLIISRAGNISGYVAGDDRGAPVEKNGGWNHVACTYDADSLTLQFYFNGRMVHREIMSEPYEPAHGFWMIGNGIQGARPVQKVNEELYVPMGFPASAAADFFRYVEEQAEPPENHQDLINGIKIYSNELNSKQFRVIESNMGLFVKVPRRYVWRYDIESYVFIPTGQVVTSNQFDGWLDEIRIYSDVLTASQIRAISKIDSLQ